MTSKALVFDIKRFAVHDGTGLRTTIFFKGCPLKCKWCQNPEGLVSKRQLLYFKNDCIHCQRCLEFSKPGQMKYLNQRPYFNYEYSGSFDNLVDACPSGAICYDSIEYDIETLIEKIKDDQVFYRDGGGVTFSGGEPLLQGKFLLEILKRCQAEKIHTAIETTAHAPLDLIKRILPYLDLIYIDLKLFDDNQHQQFTGVLPKQIKENITYILTSPYKNQVIIRTPLIPSITATDSNISQIVSFLVNIYPDVKYELLNYNPLAASKYELLNEQYALDNNLKMFNNEQMEYFYQLVSKNGLKNIIRE